LSTRPVALQLFDHANALLQNLLLLLERLDLLFNNLKFRLLRCQNFDPVILVVQLRLQRMVEVGENDEAYHGPDADEYQRQRRACVNRPTPCLRPCLSEKVYANHG
jgi:hypothetical protein